MTLSLREALHMFRRAPLLSALSITTIAFALFVVGLFGLVAVNLQRSLERVAERVEVVAYVLPGTPIEASTLALGDIGQHYPDSDPTFTGIDSRRLLRDVARRLREMQLRVVNVDSTILAQEPRMAPHIPRMIGNIAADLQVAPAAINVKATTTEHLGFLGRVEGIAAQAVALIEPIPMEQNP